MSSSSVAANLPPQLAAIPNQQVQAGQSISVPLSFSDSDGQVIEVEASGVDFVSVRDLTANSAYLDLAPKVTDSGTFTIQVWVTDDLDGQATRSFLLTVNPSPSQVDITNLALNVKAYTWSEDYPGSPLSNVNDGVTDQQAYFRAGYHFRPYVEIELSGMSEVYEIEVYSGFDYTWGPSGAISGYQIQAHNGGCFETLPNGQVNGGPTNTHHRLQLGTAYVTDRIRLFNLPQGGNIREIKVMGRSFNASRNTPMNCGQEGKLNQRLSAGYDYGLYLPPGYNAGANRHKRYLLVVSLHGNGGKILHADRSGVLGQPEGFIRQMTKPAMVEGFEALVLAPHFAPPGNTGSGWLSYQTVHKMVEKARREYRVDPDRVVVTGLSAGGAETMNLIRHHRDSLYAAFVPVAFNPPHVSLYCHYLKAPIWSFVGLNDHLMQQGHIWKEMKDFRIFDHCGQVPENMRVTEYPDLGHSASLWDGAYSEPELHNFLRNVRRSQWINGSYTFP